MVLVVPGCHAYYYPLLVISVVLFVIVDVHISSALQNDFMSRHDFLLQQWTRSSILFLPQGIIFPPHNDDMENDDSRMEKVEIPLQFLPRGGCLALKININDKRGLRRLFSYYAVVDTGSPFVTAPNGILPYSTSVSRRYPPTKEQYGETVGSMVWRSVSNAEINTKILEQPLLLLDSTSASKRMIVGIPGDDVVDDTGGIFLGLILQDDVRPTALHQLGYNSFILDYRSRCLILGKKNVLDQNDPDAMELFDFAPYGSNIHHYGVVANSFALVYSSRTATDSEPPIAGTSLKRPVVAVIDSGLTGCVFSDSLRDELLKDGRCSSLQKLSGLQVTLPTKSGDSLTLVSNPEYWSLASFKLPWFDDDESHPHVIAMGATFLVNTRISMDPLSRRTKIEGIQKVA
jgi:hypothetical protein